MIRVSEFLISQRPYAVDMSTLRTEPVGGESFRAAITAVWFRRRQGTTIACTGELWDYQRPVPADAEEFLRNHDDGRYGGDCKGRWDGTRYWGAQEPETAQTHLALLRPMLDNYPQIPDGFDGWWTFKARP